MIQKRTEDKIFGHTQKEWMFALTVTILGLSGLLIGGFSIQIINDPLVSWRRYAMSAYIVGYVLGIMVSLLFLSIANKWNLPLIEG